jgi:O-methyltransferase
MDNAFITQYFDWNRPETGKARLLNRLFRALGIDVRVVRPQETGEMTSVEQRINLFHLASQVLVYRVPGDVVEIGCRAGSTAVLLESVIASHDSSRTLHVYDGFYENTPTELLDNFRRLGLRPPVVHSGPFDQTLPAALPDRICFAHVDLGMGPAHVGAMESALRRILPELYDRLAPGAIGVIADYCDPDLYRRPGFVFPACIRFTGFWHIYPQVKRVCDEFFVGRPEQVHALYGGEFSHGYFRKSV